MKKAYKSIGTFAILSAIILLSSGTTVPGKVTKENFDKTMSNDLKTWSDGPVIDINYNSRNQVNIRTSSKGLSKGYYTSYIFQSTESYNTVYDNYDYKTTAMTSDWSSYDGVSFHIKNMSSGKVKINVSLLDKDKGTMTILDDNPVIFQDSNNSWFSYVRDSYLTLPDNFDGNLYIPFSSMDDRDETLKNVQCFGIIISNLENEEKNILVGDFSLLTGDDISEMDKLMGISIMGKTSLPIPTAGSSITQYSVKIRDLKNNIIDKKTSFYLKEPVDGVEINSDGILSVNHNAKAGTIKIYVSMDGYEDDKSYIEVELIEKDMNNLTSREDEIMLTIPKPDEMKNYNEIYSWLLSDKNKNCILIGISIAVVVFSFIIFKILTA